MNFCSIRLSVRDYLPLQQGLRLIIQLFLRLIDISQRLSSTTTRIKTPLLNQEPSLKSQRLSSTTTRIKTNSGFLQNRKWNWCQRLSSTTTRIKTVGVLLGALGGVGVRDYLPLQQGLRRNIVLTKRAMLAVRDYLPLQQGLRLSLNRGKNGFAECQRLSSTTTRIKTFPAALGWRQRLCQRLSSITTRIKTNKRLSGKSSPRSSETIFHYNKD